MKEEIEFLLNFARPLAMINYVRKVRRLRAAIENGQMRARQDKSRSRGRGCKKKRNRGALKKRRVPVPGYGLRAASSGRGKDQTESGQLRKRLMSQLHGRKTAKRRVEDEGNRTRREECDFIRWK